MIVTETETETEIATATEKDGEKKKTAIATETEIETETGKEAEANDPVLERRTVRALATSGLPSGLTVHTATERNLLNRRASGTAIPLRREQYRIPSMKSRKSSSRRRITEVITIIIMR